MRKHHHHRARTRKGVCTHLMWSTTTRELMPSHGARNQLVLGDMLGARAHRPHTTRDLHLAISPNDMSVASGGADETLRCSLRRNGPVHPETLDLEDVSTCHCNYLLSWTRNDAAPNTTSAKHPRPAAGEISRTYIFIADREKPAVC